MIRWSGQGVGGGWGCVGADKERGRTIWVAWSRSSSLSAAETLHAFFLFFFFFRKFPFALTDKLCIRRHACRQKAKKGGSWHCATRRLYPH